MARASAFDRDVQTAIAGARGQVKTLLIAEITRQVERVEQDNRPPFIRRFVDGVKDRPLAEIDPFGRAFFTFHYLRDAVRDAVEILRSTSPVDTGAYQSSHNVFIDDASIAPVVGKGDGGSLWSYSLLDRITDQSRVAISPTVEYARIIESGYRGSSVEAKHVYRNATTAIQRRWGGVIIARFEFIGQDVPGARYARQPAMVLEAVG